MTTKTDEPWTITEREDQQKRVNPGWKDPECPKCGLKLGNRMAYCCGESYCPSGLN